MHDPVPIEEFFTRLSALFESQRREACGSIFLTQKRYSFDPTVAPSSDETFKDLGPQAQPSPLLIRATNGRRGDNIKDKIKLSTLVSADDLNSFYTRYLDVCRAGMSGLKKRDRKKRTKKRREGESDLKL